VQRIMSKLSHHAYARRFRHVIHYRAERDGPAHSDGVTLRMCELDELSSEPHPRPALLYWFFNSPRFEARSVCSLASRSWN